MQHVLIIGASGGIGAGLTDWYLQQGWHVSALSRSAAPATADKLDWYRYAPDALTSSNAAELQQNLQQIFRQPPSLVFCCLGALHGNGLVVEKNIRQLDAAALQQAFYCNTVLPGLWLQQLWPWLSQSPAMRLCWLSAKVGSLSDNRAGGWYSYRASKAALNMLVKTAAIELARQYPKATLISLHPGTTDTALSAPFQRNLAAGQLQTPLETAARLAAVAADLTAAQNGALLNWDGQVLPF